MRRTYPWTCTSNIGNDVKRLEVVQRMSERIERRCKNETHRIHMRSSHQNELNNGERSASMLGPTCTYLEMRRSASTLFLYRIIAMITRKGLCQLRTFNNFDHVQTDMWKTVVLLVCRRTRFSPFPTRRPWSKGCGTRGTGTLSSRQSMRRVSLVLACIVT